MFTGYDYEIKDKLFERYFCSKCDKMILVDYVSGRMKLSDRFEFCPGAPRPKVKKVDSIKALRSAYKEE
jgi:hypothetical protein